MMYRLRFRSKKATFFQIICPKILMFWSVESWNLHSFDRKLEQAWRRKTQAFFRVPKRQSKCLICFCKYWMHKQNLLVLFWNIQIFEGRVELLAIYSDPMSYYWAYKWHFENSYTTVFIFPVQINNVKQKNNSGYRIE